MVDDNSLIGAFPAQPVQKAAAGARGDGQSFDMSMLVLDEATMLSLPVEAGMLSFTI